jgi:hypothetical protein
MSASIASAQAPAELTKARAERGAAMAAGDRAVFDKLTTEQFYVVDPTGRVENKAERGARVVPPTNPGRGGGPAPLINEKVSLYNNDMAVATWDANQGGAVTHFMEIWVKDGGQWKCAAVSLNRPPAPAAGGEGRGEGRRGGN